MSQLSLTIRSIGDVQGNATHAITVGKSTVELTTEAALVKSAAFRKLFLTTLPTQLAFEKAAHGNYRAAVEILGLVAGKAVVKAIGPSGEAPWKKGAVLNLAEKVLDKPAGAKGYTSSQLVVRSLAKAIIERLTQREATIQAEREQAEREQAETLALGQTE